MTGLAREVDLPGGRCASGTGGRVFIVEKEAECILLMSNSLENRALCLPVVDALGRTARNTSQRLLSCSNSDCSELENCNQTSVARGSEGPAGALSPGKRPGSHYRNQWSARMS